MLTQLTQHATYYETVHRTGAATTVSVLAPLPRATRYYSYLNRYSPYYRRHRAVPELRLLVCTGATRNKTASAGTIAPLQAVLEPRCTARPTQDPPRAKRSARNGPKRPATARNSTANTTPDAAPASKNIARSCTCHEKLRLAFGQLLLVLELLLLGLGAALLVLGELLLVLQPLLLPYSYVLIPSTYFSPHSYFSLPVTSPLQLQDLSLI